MKWDGAAIRGVMRQFNLHAAKSLGQHFLSDFGIVREIAELSGADENTGVVEIGPGLGILTAALAENAARVVSLEVDRRLLPVLDYTLEGLDNVQVFNQDALKADFRTLVSEQLPGLRPVLCANLPYNITTPLLTAILKDASFERVTVMVQREVARRLTARHDTPDYGAFTIFVHNRADARIALEVPASSFMPPPKVDSAVVVLERVPLRYTHPMYERVVRAAFAQRRKQLINALAAGLALPRERVSSALESCGICPQMRGEALSPPDFARLAEAFE